MRFFELIKEMEAHLKASSSPGTFWRHAPELFSTVIENGLHTKALNELLIGVRDENLPITAIHTAGQFLALHISPYSSWAIIFHKSPIKFLYLSPVDALQARIGGADLDVTRFHCSEPASFEVLQPDLELVQDDSMPAPLNAIFTRHGRSEILDWRTPAESIRPGVTLRINSGLLADFEWAFDRVRKRPVGLSGIDPVKSNMTTIFSLLASVGDHSSIEHLRPFLRSDKHFLRWHAAQTIAAIDAAEGMASVTALADDPHVEVRMAARKSLHDLASAA